MKKIVASVGLIALGASGLEAVRAQGLTAPDTSKPWSASVTLRGFYDDNINSLPQKQEALEMEVSPALNVGWSSGPTTIAAGYMYSAKYYDHTPYGQTDRWSQQHAFNLALNHAFSERYQVGLRDSFVIGQEPDFLRAGNTFATFQRIPGDNIRNDGGITFDAQLTRDLGLQLGYDNAYYNYADHGAVTLFDPVFGIPLGVLPSRSGLLDRMEHYAHIDAKWLLQPQTTALIGYQYGEVDYTADEVVGIDLASGREFRSEIRNNRSHYFYVGGDHTFRPDLTASVRAGARYNDYYNDPNNESSWSPYFRLSGTYTYLPESYAQLGFTYDRSATDLIGISGSDFTRDQDAAVVFGSVHHKIAPKLFGTLLGQFQNSSYNGGAFNNQTERFYLVGLNVEYQFTPNFSAEAGYNYDKLDSDAGRSFDRNRVYMGVTARY